MAFSYNGDLYTMKDGQKPAKVDIKVYSDQDERDVERYALAGGASAIAIAPSQKEVALVLRGDVFVTSADYKTTKRITNTATQERDLSFSSDGRTIYYSAERDGNWGIWRTSLTKKRTSISLMPMISRKSFSPMKERPASSRRCHLTANMSLTSETGQNL